MGSVGCVVVVVGFRRRERADPRYSHRENETMNDTNDRPRIEPGQRYACRDCGAERVIPESPTTGPKRLRIGCEPCGTIMTHRAVGRV